MGLLFLESTEIDNGKEFLVIKEVHHGRLMSVPLVFLVSILVLALIARFSESLANYLFFLPFLLILGVIITAFIEIPFFKISINRWKGKEIRMKGSLYSYVQKNPFELWIES